MKIVMSLNTEPIKKKVLEQQKKGNALWGDEKGVSTYLRRTIINLHLSCLLAKTYYGRVEFVTDELGYDLSSILKLPFTKTDVLSFKHVDDKFWAYGKLKAYELQEEPFLHIDNDVFLFRRFPKIIHQAPVVAEMLETNNIHYKNGEKIITPGCPKSFIKHHKDKVAYCMGIFGGNDLQFISDYSKQALKWCDNQNWDSVYDNGLRDDILILLDKTLMTKVEQQLMYCESKEKGVNIFSLVDNGYLPEKYGYLHLKSLKYFHRYDRKILQYFKTYFSSEFDHMERNIECLIKTIIASDQNVNSM